MKLVTLRSKLVVTCVLVFLAVSLGVGGWLAHVRISVDKAAPFVAVFDEWVPRTPARPVWIPSEAKANAEKQAAYRSGEPLRHPRANAQRNVCVATQLVADRAQLGVG
jgi:hypothetical protein